jgi:predicted DNA-binding transcriptional regulator YafY
MPVNRNALIRYRTLDNCLRNPYRQWTLDDLIEAVSDALYEYEGILKGVSKRTVQMDIQMMRSDKLGYNAPITVIDKKYYKYEDPDYSITNIPITDQDIYKLNEVVEILKQFKGFSHFQELNGMVQKLEDKIHTAKTKQDSIIDFEKNENMKGLEYIDALYQSILSDKAIELTYQSFNARKPETFQLHPYLLKEYRNRWFVIGEKEKRAGMLNLALDRILNLEATTIARKECSANLKDYFKDVLGVTVNRDEAPLEIKVFFEFAAAPYVLTKPIHHSQRVIEKTPHGVIIGLTMQWNYELEREILGFGDRARLIAPQRLVSRMQRILTETLESYQTAPERLGSKNLKLTLEKKGSVVINQFFATRFMNNAKKKVEARLKELEEGTATFGIRNAFEIIPDLKEVLFHQNLQKLIRHFGKDYFVTKAIYFDKLPKENWYVTWHQDKTINVKEKIETEGFRGWSAKDGFYSVIPPESILKNTITIRVHLDDASESNGCLTVLPGSHTKMHSDNEVKLITENSNASAIEIPSGGIQIMKPLILHASKKATVKKRRRVLHLELCNQKLTNGLDWAERVDLKHL